MSKTQISRDGGNNWTALDSFNFREEFDLNLFTSEFVNAGANSKMTFKLGGKVLVVTLDEGFTLEVLDQKLIVKSHQDLDSLSFEAIDFNVLSARLIAAPNGGGIGIADIRDQGFLLRGFVFDIKDTLVSIPPKQGAQVTIFFNDGYRFGRFELPMPPAL